MAQRDANHWYNDWAAFVQAACRHLDQGMDNRAVTAIYSARPVTWVGVVGKKRLEDNRPGVQLDMPLISCHFSDGRQCDVDYLFLHLKREDVSAWGKIDIGATVRFTTSINGADGLFPGIRLQSFEGKRATIILGAGGGIPLSKISVTDKDR